MVLVTLMTLAPALGCIDARPRFLRQFELPRPCRPWLSGTQCNQLVFSLVYVLVSGLVAPRHDSRCARHESLRDTVNSDSQRSAAVAAFSPVPSCARPELLLPDRLLLQYTRI